MLSTKIKSTHYCNHYHHHHRHHHLGLLSTNLAPTWSSRFTAATAFNLPSLQNASIILSPILTLLSSQLIIATAVNSAPLIVRHGKTGQNFLTQPEPDFFLLEAKTDWPMIRPDFFASHPNPTQITSDPTHLKKLANTILKLRLDTRCIKHKAQSTKHQNQTIVNKLQDKTIASHAIWLFELQNHQPIKR